MTSYHSRQSIIPIDKAGMEDFFILGLPIETDIGNCHFLKVKDYPRLKQHLDVISLTRQHYINNITTSNKDNPELIDKISELSLIQFVGNFPEVEASYSLIFSEFFRDDSAFLKIQTEEQFEYYRGLILKLSCIKEEVINPNPEIQKSIERSKRLKSSGSSMSFADIVSSVSAVKGVGYNEILEQTLYQMYMDFYRISHIFNFETSRLFATVAEKVEIEDWNKGINMFEDEKAGLTRSEFSKVAGVVSNK